jgi:hypothetical protein
VDHVPGDIEPHPGILAGERFAQGWQKIFSQAEQDQERSLPNRGVEITQGLLQLRDGRLCLLSERVQGVASEVPDAGVLIQQGAGQGVDHPSIFDLQVPENLGRLPTDVRTFILQGLDKRRDRWRRHLGECT